MFGVDYLGGAKYPDVILRDHPNNFAAGFFLDTFGDATGVIRKLCRTMRCPRIRVQILYKGLHSRPEHYNPSTDDPIILKGIRRINAIKAEFPFVDFQASPYCEHPIRGQRLTNLLNKCHEAARDITIVNNPQGIGDFDPRFVNEVHSILKRPSGVYNFSYDGLAQVDSDIELFKEFHASALTFFLWEPACNGRHESDDTTPIDQRRDYLTVKELDSMIYQTQHKGNVNLEAHWLYKSHSEDKGGTDARANKPCIIGPTGASKVELVAANGQIIEILPRYPVNYSDGRARFYSDEWGYQLADKAKRIQGGDPVVRVRVQGKIKGTINPAFRQNEYRNKVKE